VRDGQENLSEAFTAIVADEPQLKALQFVAAEATLLRFEVLPTVNSWATLWGAISPGPYGAGRAGPGGGGASGPGRHPCRGKHGQ